MTLPGESFSSQKDYIDSLLLRSSTPKGFLFASEQVSFYPKELLQNGKPHKINIATILAPKPTTSWAAKLTSNRFVGAPVELIRNYTKCNTPVRGIIINNKVANVGVPTGKTDQNQLIDTYLRVLNLIKRFNYYA